MQPGRSLCCHTFLPRSPIPSRGLSPAVRGRGAASPRRLRTAGLCRPGGGPAAPQPLASPLPPGAVLNMSKITSILCFPPPPRFHAQTRNAGPLRGGPYPGQWGEGRALRPGRPAEPAAGPSGLGGIPGRAVPAELSRWPGHGRSFWARPVPRARHPIPPRRGRCQAAAASPPGGPCARRRPGRRFPLPPLA